MSKEQPDRRAPRLSRRSFLRQVGMVPLVSVPAIAALARSPASTYAVEPWIAYHDRTGAYHQAEWDRLYPLGYRIISLSVYGDPADPRYAAVWVKRDGPPWVGIHNATAQQYQDFFDTWAAQGFGPTILSVAGSGSNLVFAGVSEQMSGSIPLTRFGLVSGDVRENTTFQFWDKWARDNNQTLRWASIYGTAADPRYACIWAPNTDKVTWNTDGINDTSAEHQARFDAQASHWARPAFVTLSSSQRYLSHFRGDQIGPWVAQHDMTSQGYQTEFDKWVAQGFYPVCVQGGGVGSEARFAAIFAKQDSPIGRRFTLRDSTDLPHNAIDDVMGDMMVANGIRQAALAVVHGTSLLFARGYTWAEPDYPLATVTTHFRVASCSKILTTMMVLRLVQEGRLRLEDKIQDILQLRTPDDQPPIDGRFNQITILQALTLTSGLRYKWHEGPEVVRAFCAHLPATKLQIARYEVGQPGLMVRDPGERAPCCGDKCPDCNRLSDFGYLLVSLVVEKIASTNGESFAQLVRDRIGRPLAATRIRNAAALVSEQQQDEARYHDDELKLGQSVMSDNQPQVPVQYGAFNLLAGAASGGLSVAAVDFARVLAALNLRSNNPVLDPEWIDTMLRDFIGWDFPHGDGTPAGSYHRVKGGLLDGLQSTVNFTQDQFAYVVYWARDDVRGIWYPEFPALQDAIRTTLDPQTRDRFPDFGIPSFSSTTVNLARNKPASQSSTAWDGWPDRAVDGNTDGDFWNGSVTHTAVEPQAWWEVDLGAARQIDRVDVYNRTDCCGERLSNFYILVSDAPFSSASLDAVRAQPGVSYQHIAGGQQCMSAAFFRSGRYVRIQLAGADALSLAEVQIWGPQ